jgi:hypothetical protein
MPKWKPHPKTLERKNDIAKAMRSSGHYTQANQLEDCHEQEMLMGCQSCRGTWWSVSRCGLRVCPICSRKLAWERTLYIKAMIKKQKFPKFITLTMPRWTQGPAAGVTFLKKCFSKLRERKYWKNVKGGCYTVELKEKEDGWHIHIHIICDAAFLPYQQLFSEWRDLIGLKHAQTDIRALKGDEQIAYAAKYASKGADLYDKPDATVRWYEATKGVRLWGTFGEWYNATIDELLDREATDDKKTVCPHCKEEGHAFRVRDGPFVFGPDLWRSVESIYLKTGSDHRPIADAARSTEETESTASPLAMSEPESNDPPTGECRAVLQIIQSL